MDRRRTAHGLALLVAVCGFAAPVRAGEGDGGTLRVGVFRSPPFVMYGDDGRPFGMAVKLWEAVAEAAGLTYEYAEYPNVGALVAAAASGEADLIVTDLSVTHERARHVKYTYPWYDAGLRIMVRADEQASLWRQLRRNGQFHAYAVIVALFLAVTVLVTVVRRRRQKPDERHWGNGLALSFYDLVTAVNSGELREDIHERGWPGHLLAAAWMLFGIGLVAYITSSVTAAMTMVSLTGGEVVGFADLSGKRVGVGAGSLAEEYLRPFNLTMVPFDGVEHSGAALAQGLVHAVVEDAPILEYWVATHPEQQLRVVGDLFRPDKYAFAGNPRHADLIDAISVELIRLQESGFLRRLHDQYFPES